VSLADERWRVSIDLSGCQGAGRRPGSSVVAGDLRSHFGDQVRVSSGKTHVYLYSAAADVARQAAEVAGDILARYQLTADLRLEYWDLPGERWKEAAAGLPDDADCGPNADREALNEQQRQRSARTGLAGWQVRVQMPTHAEVKALSQRLASEGWPVLLRRKYLVAGADCEEDAEALAVEIQGYSSAAAAISVQRTVFAWDPSPTALLFGP